MKEDLTASGKVSALVTSSPHELQYLPSVVWCTQMHWNPITPDSRIISVPRLTIFHIVAHRSRETSYQRMLTASSHLSILIYTNTFYLVGVPDSFLA